MHLFHYYVNTVQYITYSVNTVQYITVVNYLVQKYCAVLTSVDSNDILLSAGSTANVIKGGCSTEQAKFRVLKMDVSILNMDVSQDQRGGQIPLDR